MVSSIIALQVIACFLIIALVLLQPSKGGSFFTASNQGVFGSSGGTTFLFRATMWCSVFLAVSCLFLSWFKLREAGESVITDTKVNTQPMKSPTGTTTAPPAAAPGAPVTTPPPAPTKELAN